MTASDIIYIATTVALVQGICDTFANHFMFSSDTYKRCYEALEKARIKRDNTIAQIAENPISVNSKSSAKAKDKQIKRLKQLEEDYQTAVSNVSLRHIIPNVMTTVVFCILYKILSAEYQGKIIAVLPFTPWTFLQRFTLRGVNFDSSFAFEGSRRVPNMEQGCSFLVIYLLATMSVKFMVKQVLGVQPPSGADKGMFSMIDDPRVERVLKSFGLDIDDINEVRKSM